MAAVREAPSRAADWAAERPATAAVAAAMEGDRERVLAARRAAARFEPTSSQELRARVGALVACDLALHGWTVEASAGRMTWRPPSRLDARAEEKRRVQAQLSVERDRQLREPAVRTFLRTMESARPGPRGLVSVFDLMRDGPSLATGLRAAEGDPDALRELIRPRLQVVEPGARCDDTGLLLTEVWRYFRHTWSNPYRSTPGRGLQLLVRDAALSPQPVVGIAMIGSVAAQLALRDAWIGWAPDTVVEELRGGASRERASWATRTLGEELRELYVDDLLEDEVITPAELRTPSEATLRTLRDEARTRRAEHRHAASAARRGTAARPGGLELTRSPLYRAKRCELLAELLQVRRALAPDQAELTAASLTEAAWTSEGERAIRTLARRSKARRMGSAIAEITVCGAVAPYRELLGGKLVSLLMMSAEVRWAWRERYDGASSVIASAMAGRPIKRGAELTALMTTSLYGSGSSQYNRVRLPRRALGEVGDDTRYLELGLTVGYGSSHFADDTVRGLVKLVEQASGGARVNSIFGEGVSPRLRKVREGLDLLGLDSDALLQHGSPRVIYGVPLALNSGRVLQGLDDEPRGAPGASLAPADATAAISEYWRRRWLAARSRRVDVLDAVAAHTLDRPVRHGARVVLPTDAEGQLALFDT